jgi:hypothetical protein
VVVEGSCRGEEGQERIIGIIWSKYIVHKYENIILFVKARFPKIPSNSPRTQN